jgi:hypothetical protein
MPAAGKDAQRFQQAAGRLVNDPKLADTMTGLDNDPQDRQAAKSDPKGFLKRKGHDIPEEAEVTFKEGSWSVKICGFGYCITISS